VALVFVLCAVFTATTGWLALLSARHLRRSPNPAHHRCNMPEAPIRAAFGSCLYLDGGAPGMPPYLKTLLTRVEMVSQLKRTPGRSRSKPTRSSSSTGPQGEVLVSLAPPSWIKSCVPRRSVRSGFIG